MLALNKRCAYLALRIESRKSELIISRGISCMLELKQLEWVRIGEKCSLKTVVGLDLILGFSTDRLCSLNLFLG